jgi:hypothetical protein
MRIRRGLRGGRCGRARGIVWRGRCWRRRRCGCMGGRPLLMDLEAVRDDDHVVALYRERGLWGGIAKSNYAGLRFRAPVYRTLRELALSYVEHYYNLREKGR